MLFGARVTIQNFASSANICFINLASPNKDKIRDFSSFYSGDPCHALTTDPRTRSLQLYFAQNCSIHTTHYTQILEGVPKKISSSCIVSINIVIGFYILYVIFGVDIRISIHIQLNYIK